jgi:hypothetical protein
MTTRQRKALERQVEFAQERTRRNMNRMVQQQEDEYRAVEEEAAKRRGAFRVVESGA